MSLLGLTPRARFLFLILYLASSISCWLTSAYLSSAHIELGLSLDLSPSDQFLWGTSAMVLPLLYSGTSIALLNLSLDWASSLSFRLLLSFILSRAQGGQMAKMSFPSLAHLSLLSSLAMRQVLYESTVLVQWRGKLSNDSLGEGPITWAPSGLANLGFLKGS